MNDDLQRYLDELRTRISIVDVVGAKVKLVKKGREYQGLCPFHNEKTPSFTVNESKGFYHCFGCGAHGDIIKFEMEANGLPFIDAIEKLSHQAGLQMPKLNKADKTAQDERKSLYEIMELACKFFEKNLFMPEGAEGLKYFKEKRGLTKETIQKFRLGFSPQNNGLMAYLKKEGIEEKELSELGLIAIPEDKTRHTHDFFRNRVMIPITNKQGKIIAFGGRVMEKIEPKYLNSPDTPIFNKRRNLYNLDKARESAYKEKKLIICEGYMDVIALDTFGFNYAVAPLGTALTEEQIAEAWKVCPEPILCLDGDSPGVKAAMRAVDRVLPMLKAGYSLKFLFLPDNLDPDEFLHSYGKGKFQALMEETKPLIDILWQKYTENQASDTPERKALIEKTLWEEVKKIPDKIVQNYYADEIKKRLYLNFKKPIWNSTQIITKDIDTPLPQYTPQQKIAYTRTSQPYATKKREYKSQYNSFNRQTTIRTNICHTVLNEPSVLSQSAEQKDEKNWRFIIAALIYYPELIEDYEEQLLNQDITNPNLYNILITMVDIIHEESISLTSEKLINELTTKGHNDTLKNLWEINMLKERNPFINELRKNINDLLLNLRLKHLEEEIKDLTHNLSKNFNNDDYIRLSALIKERDDILTKATEEHQN